MLSSDFQFFAPTTLHEALALAAEHEEGKVLAGGMSMVPAINLGVLRPTALISLNHVPGLGAISDGGDALHIGALARHATIARDPLVAAGAPLLAAAASRIGDVQIRNRGTIGGSVAHADPAADYLPALVALDATLELASAGGRRSVAAREFFVDVMVTALTPGEVLVEVRVPKQPPGAGFGYTRLARVEGSFAIANAAALVDGQRSALAIGAAVPTPVLVAIDVANATPDEIGEATFVACAEAYGDLSGSPGYRKAMARVMARRAVAQARAGRGREKETR